MECSWKMCVLQRNFREMHGGPRSCTLARVAGPWGRVGPRLLPGAALMME